MSRQTTCWLTALFVLVAFVVLFHKLGSFRTLGSHEAFAVVPAREMMESGNWIVPRFGGLPRLQKPPLVYWVLGGTATLFGELTERVARIPAAISALTLSLLIGYWAGRWYGRTAGWAAAFAQLTAVFVLIFARKAEIDMMLCLFTTTAMFLVANQPDTVSVRRQFLRWIGFWGLLSLAWLGKFHYGPAMVLAPCGLYFLIQKRYRGIWNFFNPVGLLLFAAAVFIWPYLLLQQVPNAWQIWKAETLGRAMGVMGHEPIWFYVPHIFWLTLPWTPFAIAAVPDSWRRAWKEADPRERFLWIWLLTQFAIVTLSANKHKHYLGTALPVVSLLAAQTLSRLVERIKRDGWEFRRKSAVTASVFALTVGGLVVVLGVEKWPQLRTAFVVIGSMIAVGGLISSFLAYRGRPFRAGLTIAGTLLFCYAGVNSWIVPRRDHRLVIAHFAQESRRKLSAEIPIAVYRMGKTPLVYYLESPVRRIESQASLAERLNREGRLFIVTLESLAKEVTACGKGRLLRQMTPLPGVPHPKHAPLVLLELTQKPQLPAVATAPQSAKPQSTAR